MFGFSVLFLPLLPGKVQREAELSLNEGGSKYPLQSQCALGEPGPWPTYNSGLEEGLQALIRQGKDRTVPGAP